MRQKTNQKWFAPLTAALFLFLLCMALPLAAQAAGEETATFSSWSIYTYREESYGAPPNGTEGTGGCHVALELTFPGNLTVEDAEAAGKSIVVSGDSTVMGTGDFAVTAEGNVLKLDTTATYMPGGILIIKAGDIEGVTCEGKQAVFDGDFETVTPTGLSLRVTDVTVGTADTPASTTVTVDSSAVIRSMNHILWTSDGAAILDGTGTDQTTPAHHHNYWSFTPATSASFIEDGVGSALSQKGYSVTCENDTVTITAATPKEGEYLGIYNYDDDFLQQYGQSLSGHVEGLSQQETVLGKDIGKRCTISMASSMDYTGEALIPELTVTDGWGTALVEGTDYSVSVTDNVEWKSQARVTVTGLGDYAGSSVVRYFTITKPLSKEMFTVDTADETYSGKAILKNVTAQEGLTEGTDYTVNHFNNAFPGTASVKISGAGDYSGTLEYTYTILPITITGEMFSANLADVSYTGSAVCPEVSSDLKANRDYTVSYEENVNPGTARIVIRGKGNYTGEVVFSFTILSSGNGTPASADSASADSASAVSALSAPVLQKIRVKKAGVKLRWSDVSADSYRVMYRVKGTSRWKTKKTAATALTLKKLKKGKKYQVKIVAVRGAQTAVSKTKTTKKVK